MATRRGFVVDTARGRGSAMRLTGGPWDGREVDVGMGVRVLVVPFIPTDGQRVVGQFQRGLAARLA